MENEFDKYGVVNDPRLMPPPPARPHVEGHFPHPMLTPPYSYPEHCHSDVHIHIDADGHHMPYTHGHTHGPLPPVNHYQEHQMPCTSPDFQTKPHGPLMKDNFLGEFVTEADKAKARHNLGLDALGGLVQDSVRSNFNSNYTFHGRLSVSDKEYHLPKDQWKKVASIYGLGIVNIVYIYANIDIECYTNTIHAETPDALSIEKEDDHIKVVGNDVYVRDAFTTAVGSLQPQYNAGNLNIVIHDQCTQDIVYKDDELTNTLWAESTGASISVKKIKVGSLTLSPDSAGIVTLPLATSDDLKYVLGK